MGVLLQGFFQHNGVGVPSSSGGNPGAPAWWDHLAAQANALRQSGFTAIWLPPVTKGKSGAQSIGYDVFDDYDLGAKNQKGSIPTRYGSRQQLQRCVAVMRANGIEVFVDLVDHQRAGGQDFTYRYVGANGVAGTGRFPKDPPNFHPQAPPEPNVVDRSLSFGDDLAPITGKPKDYVFNGLIEAADWLTRALDLQGYRFDDAKGTSTDFAFPLFTQKSMKGKFVGGEFFDTRKRVDHQTDQRRIPFGSQVTINAARERSAADRTREHIHDDGKVGKPTAERDVRNRRLQSRPTPKHAQAPPDQRASQAPF